MEKLYDYSWDSVLEPLFKEKYWRDLQVFIENERRCFTVYPSEDLVFNAMKLTAFSDIKVVILGQDPYHNIGQAHGLSFSVPNGVKIPPSLKNIFTELASDVEGFITPKSGDLTYWAQQGVLLLNTIFTVRAHEAGSHQKKGWEQFTDQLIRKIDADLEGVVFILWGSYAQKKRNLINTNKHLVIESAHPSPLSVYRGFWGSKPFSQANTYLVSRGKHPIDWKLV